MKKILIFVLFFVFVPFSSFLAQAQQIDTTKPSIKIIKPNGGEIFNLKNPITITWEDKNLENAGVFIYLKDYNVDCSNNSENCYNSYAINDMAINNNFSAAVPIKNTGTHIFDTNKQLFGVGSGNTVSKYLDIKLGNKYKIAVCIKNTCDESDNFFVINSLTSESQNVSECLKDKGAVLYGTFWCPHCNSQKKLFGDFVSNIKYVECSTADGLGQTDLCKKENINSYPIWKFPNGVALEGSQSLEKLSQTAQCNTSYKKSDLQVINKKDIKDCVSLSISLKKNDKDFSKKNEVTKLQKFLYKNGYLKTAPTGYFGQLTFDAVKSFQSQNNISSIGSVGPVTRQKISSLSCY